MRFPTGIQPYLEPEHLWNIIAYALNVLPHKLSAINLINSFDLAGALPDSVLMPSQRRNNPPLINEQTSYQHSRAQRTNPHPSHPKSDGPPPLSSPQHHNRHYKAYTPYPSGTRLTCSCDQRYKSTIRGIFREVGILEQYLANVLGMLRDLQPSEDEMDWEYVDTIVIDNGKTRDANSGLDGKGHV